MAKWEVIHRRRNGDRLWFDGVDYAVSDGTYPTECEVIGIPGVYNAPYLIDTDLAVEKGVLLLRKGSHPSDYYRVDGLIGSQKVEHALCIEAAALLAKRLGVRLELEIDGVRFALVSTNITLKEQAAEAAERKAAETSAIQAMESLGAV